MLLLSQPTSDIHSFALWLWHLNCSASRSSTHFALGTAYGDCTRANLAREVPWTLPPRDICLPCEYSGGGPGLPLASPCRVGGLRMPIIPGAACLQAVRGALVWATVAYSARVLNDKIPGRTRGPFPDPPSCLARLRKKPGSAAGSQSRTGPVDQHRGWHQGSAAWY